VHRDQPTTTFLCRAIAELDDIADMSARIDDHVPRQVCNLACAQARFRRQQDNHAIADRLPGAIGEGQEISYIERGKYLACLPSMEMYPTSK